MTWKPERNEPGDIERSKALTAADPRAHQAKHRARLSLYEDNEDSDRTLFERGADFDDFIEAEGK